MAGIKYQIIEVIGKEYDKTIFIVRGSGFETRKEAEKHMAKMKPKENGELDIVVAYY